MSAAFPLPANPAHSALAQVFYLSDLFAAMTFETLDYRLHPVLGGISSTRWSLYDTFTQEHGKLVDTLRPLPPFATALQTVAPQQGSALLPEALVDQLEQQQNPRARLAASGLLCGDRRSNHLLGSRDADVVIGWAGPDRLAGDWGDDVLSGGSHGDRFLFGPSPLALSNAASMERDLITDFDGEAGDRLAFKGVTPTLVAGALTGVAGQILASSWIARVAPPPGEVLQPWMVQGTLLTVDWNGDRQGDLNIELPGVLQFSAAWLL